MTGIDSIIKAAAGLGALATMALVAGFFAFCALLPRASDGASAGFSQEGAAQRGIVVLTGDRGPRIERGLELQAAGYAERVLISGVHPQTTKGDLSDIPNADVLACCVDLGPWARTTRGNAIESRDWLMRNGFDEVLLVTSDYHLPRARAELRHSAPDIEIIGVPVASRVAPEFGWMSEPRAWKLLGEEYLKFLFVQLRSMV
ncbi:YdcF family protein [Parvularcula sp. ZS-1/3]|uniref:YdcF family protein n=1 Tax=Parvularcula mediterranea TaxID=2732508 RepID=A0A7Y3RL15_9PROT|nr:YdcF family protein [Parvularcula mediterranea]NNU16021.1 YdcF family protein [Parvularcula mediterranea]